MDMLFPPDNRELQEFKNSAKLIGFDDLATECAASAHLLQPNDRLQVLLIAWKKIGDFLTQNPYAPVVDLVMKFIGRHTLDLWFGRDWISCSIDHKTYLVEQMMKVYPAAYRPLKPYAWPYMFSIYRDPWMVDYLNQNFQRMQDLDIAERLAPRDLEFIQQEGLCLIVFRIVNMFEFQMFNLVKYMCVRLMMAWQETATAAGYAIHSTPNSRQYIDFVRHVFLMVLYDSDGERALHEALENIQRRIRCNLIQGIRQVELITQIIATGLRESNRTFLEFLTEFLLQTPEKFTRTAFGGAIQKYVSFLTVYNLRKINSMNSIFATQIPDNIHERLLEMFIAQRESSDEMMSTIPMVSERLFSRVRNLKALKFAYDKLKNRTRSEWYTTKISLVLAIISDELNDLEEYKYIEGKSADELLRKEQQLAVYYSELGKLFARIPYLEQEVWLTAFSLHPCKEYSDAVTKCGSRNLRAIKKQYLKFVKLPEEPSQVACESQPIEEDPPQPEPKVEEELKEAEESREEEPEEPEPASSSDVASSDPGELLKKAANKKARTKPPSKSVVKVKPVPKSRPKIALKKELVPKVIPPKKPSIVKPEPKDKDSAEVIFAAAAGAADNITSQTLDDLKYPAFALITCITDTDDLVRNTNYQNASSDQYNELNRVLSNLKLNYFDFNDILALLISPRYKRLSWAVCWKGLKKRCRELLTKDKKKFQLAQQCLADANERLLYLHIDYEKYKDKPQLDYGTIEQGYECFDTETGDDGLRPVVVDSKRKPGPKKPDEQSKRPLKRPQKIKFPPKSNKPEEDDDDDYEEVVENVNLIIDDEEFLNPPSSKQPILHNRISPVTVSRPTTLSSPIYLDRPVYIVRRSPIDPNDNSHLILRRSTTLEPRQQPAAPVGVITTQVVHSPPPKVETPLTMAPSPNAEDTLTSDSFSEPTLDPTEESPKPARHLDVPSDFLQYYLTNQKVLVSPAFEKPVEPDDSEEKVEEESNQRSSVKRSTKETRKENAEEIAESTNAVDESDDDSSTYESATSEDNWSQDEADEDVPTVFRRGFYSKIESHLQKTETDQSTGESATKDEPKTEAGAKKDQSKTEQKTGTEESSTKDPNPEADQTDDDDDDEEVEFFELTDVEEDELSQSEKKDQPEKDKKGEEEDEEKSEDDADLSSCEGDDVPAKGEQSNDSDENLEDEFHDLEGEWGEESKADEAEDPLAGDAKADSTGDSEKGSTGDSTDASTARSKGASTESSTARSKGASKGASTGASTEASTAPSSASSTGALPRSSTGDLTAPTTAPSTKASAGALKDPNSTPSTASSTGTQTGALEDPKSASSTGASKGASTETSTAPSSAPSSGASTEASTAAPKVPSKGDRKVPSKCDQKVPSKTAPSVAPTVDLTAPAPSSGATANPTAAPSSAATETSSAPSSAASDKPSAPSTAASKAGPTVPLKAASTPDPSVAPSAAPTASSTSAPRAAPSAASTAAPASGSTASSTSAASTVPLEATRTTAPSTAPECGSTVVPKATSTTGPKADPTISPNADPATGLRADSKTGPRVDPAIGPTAGQRADPVTGPSVGPAPSLRADPATATFPAIDPKADPTTGLGANPATGPSAEPASGPRTFPVIDPGTTGLRVDPAISPRAGPSTAPRVDPTRRASITLPKPKFPLLLEEYPPHLTGPARYTNVIPVDKNGIIKKHFHIRPGPMEIYSSDQNPCRSTPMQQLIIPCSGPFDDCKKLGGVIQVSASPPPSVENPTVGNQQPLPAVSSQPNVLINRLQVPTIIGRQVLVSPSPDNPNQVIIHVANPVAYTGSAPRPVAPNQPRITLQSQVIYQRVNPYTLSHEPPVQQTLVSSSNGSTAPRPQPRQLTEQPAPTRAPEPRPAQPSTSQEKPKTTTQTTTDNDGVFKLPKPKRPPLQEDTVMNFLLAPLPTLPEAGTIPVKENDPCIFVTELLSTLTRSMLSTGLSTLRPTSICIHEAVDSVTLVVKSILSPPEVPIDDIPIVLRGGNKYFEVRTREIRGENRSEFVTRLVRCAKPATFLASTERESPLVSAARQLIIMFVNGMQQRRKARSRDSSFPDLLIARLLRSDKNESKATQTEARRKKLSSTSSPMVRTKTDPFSSLAVGGAAAKYKIDPFPSLAVGGAAAKNKIDPFSSLAVGGAAAKNTIDPFSSLAVGGAAAKNKTDPFSSLAVGGAAAKYKIDPFPSLAVGGAAAKNKIDPFSSLTIGGPVVKIKTEPLLSSASGSPVVKIKTEPLFSSASGSPVVKIKTEPLFSSASGGPVNTETPMAVKTETESLRSVRLPRVSADPKKGPILMPRLVSAPAGSRKSPTVSAVHDLLNAPAVEAGRKSPNTGETKKIQKNPGETEKVQKPSKKSKRKGKTPPSTVTTEAEVAGQPKAKPQASVEQKNIDRKQRESPPPSASTSTNQKAAIVGGVLKSSVAAGLSGNVSMTIDELNATVRNILLNANQRQKTTPPNDSDIFLVPAPRTAAVHNPFKNLPVPQVTLTRIRCPQTAALLAAQRELKAKSQPETVAQKDSKVKTQPDTAAQKDSKAKTQPETAAQKDSKPKTQPETAAQKDSKAKTQPETAAQKDSKPKTQPETVAQTPKPTAKPTLTSAEAQNLEKTLETWTESFDDNSGSQLLTQFFSKNLRKPKKTRKTKAQKAATTTPSKPTAQAQQSPTGSSDRDAESSDPTVDQASNAN